MALSIKNPEVERLARELAEITGENLTEVICNALKLRFQKESGRKHPATMIDEIRRMQERVARLPRRDHRSDDELIGYNKYGIPE